MEIKPCPKCGGDGRIDKFYTMFKTDIVPIRWAVICSDCSYISHAKGTKISAIKVWNNCRAKET